MSEPEYIHPNLARLGSVYDSILEAMNSGQITVAEARSRINQLEERDDQGIRWGIDPDTGSYIRKTTFGDIEYDDPPRFGVLTPDASAYSSNLEVENPYSRISMFNVDDITAPTDLAGATQKVAPKKPSDGVSLLDRVNTDLLWKIFKIVAVVVLALVVIMVGKNVISNVMNPEPTPTQSTKPKPNKEKPDKKPSQKQENKQQN